jgi:enoyl-[acyl-carrier protein] reductase I
MGLLDGKNALIFGVANQNSIAAGIARSLSREGANIALAYGLPDLERRVKKVAEEVNCDFMELCDVSQDDQLDNIFQKFAERVGRLDILIHSVAYSPRDDLSGRFSEMSREGFRVTMDISVYSLIAMAKRGRSLMPPGSSITAMTYYAAEKVIPHYNSMAIAKAALEISVKYLAADLGPDGIRVNAISAGPIRTLAASAITGFRRLMEGVGEVSPLRRLVTQDEVGDTCVWLSSEWGRSVTGEIVHVDAGYNVLGLTARDEDVWGNKDEE